MHHFHLARAPGTGNGPFTLIWADASVVPRSLTFKAHLGWIAPELTALKPWVWACLPALSPGDGGLRWHAQGSALQGGLPGPARGYKVVGFVFGSLSTLLKTDLSSA